VGKKKQTTTSSVKPIYGKELMGAANELNSAYQGQKGAIGKVSGDMVDLSGDLLSRFRAGDPTIGAARGFLEGELSADAANNPYLDEMTGIARDRVRNDIQAKMGTRGQTGGSDYYGNVGRGMYEVDTGLRYNDYNNTKARQMQAAGMAPGVVAGEYIPLAAGMQAGAQGSMLPIQAAAANAAGTGGLLGSYTTGKQTTKQSGGFLDSLMGLAGAGLSGWASGGFG
jgi:hypothetical protein